MTERVHNWQLRLEACLAERWSKPFQWGVHDCSLFAADCVLAVTGNDPAAEFRDKYDSRESAAKLVFRAGGLGAIAAAALGDEISVSMAQVGDIGLLESQEPALVVCCGAHWLGPGPSGLVTVLSVSRAWRCC